MEIRINILLGSDQKKQTGCWVWKESCLKVFWGLKYCKCRTIDRLRRCLIQVISYTQSDVGSIQVGEYRKSQFSVVAVEDNTRIKVQLRKSGILSGNSYEVDLPKAGTIYSFQDDLEIEIKDYELLSLEELVAELEILVSHEKALVFKNQIEDVKKAFLNHYHQMIEEKRVAFYAENETATEFEYHSPIKVKFDQLLDAFRNKKNTNFKK